MEIEIIFAVVAGVIIGALARQPYVNRLWHDLEQKASQQREFAEACFYFQCVNQKLGRALEEAGVPVQRIGECDCEDCAEEWPEELEEVEL